eukprot:TRINITY_DN4100_c0_g1_i7.p1 TRINITY_DN4100_c0_g1~~TRINITY_DN4100_c0_g1_i7.p1  ORF type:complete len:329 (+),score=61.05 TRINITY_DN4100_c0_g1_i7:548-1534(+)
MSAPLGNAATITRMASAPEASAYAVNKVTIAAPTVSTAVVVAAAVGTAAMAAPAMSTAAVVAPAVGAAAMTAPAVNMAAVVAPAVNSAAAATVTLGSAPVAAAALSVDTLAKGAPVIVTPGALDSAMRIADSTGASGASVTGSAAIEHTDVRGTAAFVALNEATGAAARARTRVNTNQTVTMQRVGRYINAVNGCSVSTKTLEDATAMVASALAMEDGNDHLQVIIHQSGVSAAGDPGWASLFGQGAYGDPDVLHVFGQAHQFCRGRDVLSRARLAADADGRLVGTLHRGERGVATPSTPTSIAATAEEEELLESVHLPLPMPSSPRR